MALESNPHIQELLSALVLSDVVADAKAAMASYQESALAVAKLPIPTEATHQIALRRLSFTAAIKT